jgi:hypothetical protein
MKSVARALHHGRDALILRRMIRRVAAAGAALLLLTACASAPLAPAPPAPAPGNPAVTAAIERAEGLIKEQPLNTVFMYVLATYYDNARDVSNVVRVLTRLYELDWRLGLGPDSFPNTSASPEFRKIAAKLEALETAEHRARTAFTLPSTVRSEGIAYDEVDDVFYLSGQEDHLLRVDRNGAITKIAVAPLGEKVGRLGMEVDAARRQLWVISAAFDPAAPPEVKGRSGISVYDLRDARRVRQVDYGTADQPSFLNDLALLDDGTAFVTDTGRHQVVRLRPEGTEFEVFASDFRAPNGIAVSEDERTLYVADFRGISAIEIATGARKVLETATLLNGIDGLVEHRGSLIGIQNVLGRPRVVRVRVNGGNRVELLEAKNPLLNVPATGVVARDGFYFLNSLAEGKERIMLVIPIPE